MKIVIWLLGYYVNIGGRGKICDVLNELRWVFYKFFVIECGMKNWVWKEFCFVFFCVVWEMWFEIVVN